MKVLSLFLVACMLGATYTEAQYVACQNPNRRAGLCVHINECQPLYAVLQQPNLRDSVKDFIRASSCGTSYDNMPMVCCTRDTDFTHSRRGIPPHYEGHGSAVEGAVGDVGSGRGAGVEAGNYFYDSHAEPASFTPKRAVLFPSTEYAYTNAWNLKQRATNNPRVKRPTNVAFNGNRGGRETSMPNRLDTQSDLIPQPPSCGGITIENKIYGGDDTDLYEFPWMVLMEYRRRSGSMTTNCAGTLINQRYVLTAAHCVTGRIEREIGQLISVRLGEHDTSRKVDCNDYSCAPEAQRLGIEEVRVHELYKEKSPNQVHDIALVRLERNVHFSDSVRPICLPAVVAAEQKRAGQQYIVAGWGRTLQSARSLVKQKLNVAFVEPEQCRRKFSERKITIVPTQLCAGGKYAQDSCDGDSGGPLMRFRDGAWVLEGIVSFGFKCGLKDWPGVYTSVAAYDDWIRRNVRA